MTNATRAMDSHNTGHDKGKSMSKALWAGLRRWAIGVLLGVLLPVAAQAIQLPNGDYGKEPVSDLQVKVVGGFVSIDRQWLNDKWQINARWNPLAFEFDNLDGSVKIIDRNGSKYLKTGDAWVYDANNSIRRQSVAQLTPGQGEGSAPASLDGTTPEATAAGGLTTTSVAGYRWSDRKGNTIDYDESGRAVGYTNKNGIRVWLEYGNSSAPEANSRELSKVRDHFGRTVLAFTWAAGQIVRVADVPVAATPVRSVNYTWSDGNLTQVADLAGRVTQFSYTVKKRIEHVTDSLKRVTTYTYGPTNRIAEIRKPGWEKASPIKIEYQFDKSLRAFYVRISYSLNDEETVEEYWYDNKGRVTRFDLNGQTLTLQTIDDGTRTRTEIDPAGGKTETTLDEYDNITRKVLPDGAVSTAKYAPSHGQISEEVDATGARTVFTYDPKGNLLQVTEAAGRPEERVTTFAVDAWGQRTRLTRPGDATWRYSYDAAGNLAGINDPENRQWQQTYDAAGNVLNLTDPLQQTWTFSWDATGNLLSETDPNGHRSSYTYDAADQLIASTDGRGKTSTISYNGNGDPIKQTAPDGGAISWDYDLQGRLVGVADGSGQTSRLVRDKNGRVVKAIDGKGFEIGVGYQAEDGTDRGNQRITKITYPTFERQLRYTSAGRVRQASEIAGTEGLTTGYTYDPVGRPKTATDPNGHTRSIEYDGLGQAIKLIDPLGNEVRFAYDGRGNLTEVRDPKGNATRISYDLRDLPLTETDPLGNVTRYAYDAAGRLSETTLANGRKTTYGYDPAGRLVERKAYAADGSLAQTVSFTFDAADNLIAWNDGRSSASRSFDDTDRLLGETVNIDGTALSRAYTYHLNGQVKTATGPDGVTSSFAYDGNGQLERIDLPGEGSITVSEWKWVAPAKITLPGGTVQEMARDGFLNLSKLTVKSPTEAVLFELENRYGKLREVAGRKVDGDDTAFEYDAALQLIKADAGFISGKSETFSLDAAGNRATHSAVSGTWEYDAANRLIQRGSTTYAYDAAGNLTEKTEAGVTTTYAYDAFNRLAEVKRAGELVVRYSYDPFDRRLTKETFGTAPQTTRYLHGEEGLLAETDAAGVVQVAYGWHPEHDYGSYPLYQRRGTATYYYHNDHLGTPWRVTDKAGGIVWAADYAAFGEATIKPGAGLEQNLRFPGQYFDAETGLHYNDRRYYDPQTGRYLTQDPIGFDGGLNLYAYTRHSPTNYSDPTGEFIPCLAVNYVRCMAVCAATGILGKLQDCDFEPGKMLKDCATSCLFSLIPFNPCGKLGKWLSAAVGTVGGLMNSFPGETEVHTPNGKKRIDALKPGDEVMAYAEWDDTTRAEKVTDLILSHKEQTIVTLTIEGGEKIQATGGHPLKTPEGWRAAQLLKAGGQLDLKGSDGKLRAATIKDVGIETRTIAVYNLEVANAHTFFVGDDGVLAHNGLCDIGIKHASRKRAKEAAEHPHPGKKLPTPKKGAPKKKRDAYDEQEKYKKPERHPTSPYPDSHFHDRNKSTSPVNRHHYY